VRWFKVFPRSLLHRPALQPHGFVVFSKASCVNPTSITPSIHKTLPRLYLFTSHLTTQKRTRVCILKRRRMPSLAADREASQAARPSLDSWSRSHLPSSLGSVLCAAPTGSTEPASSGSPERPCNPSPSSVAARERAAALGRSRTAD